MLDESRQTCGGHQFVIDALKRLESKVDKLIEQAGHVERIETVMCDLKATVFDPARGNLSDRVGKIEGILGFSKILAVPIFASIILTSVYGIVKLLADFWIHLKH